MNRSPGVDRIRHSRAPISRFERNRGRALELFATEGFGQVSMRRLASHLDLTAGSLYNHCASKEELLLEFIEEHYAGLLAVLNGHRGSKISLQLLARRLVELHDQSPMHFQVATRDIVCLKPAQRLQIELLRQQLRKKIEDSIKIETSSKNSPSAQPLLELFEHLPLWLSRYPLEVTQRCKVLEQLLIAAL